MKKHKTILLPLGRQFSIILVLFIVCTAGITLYNTQDYVRVQTDFLSSSLDSYSSQLAKNPWKPTIATKTYAIALHTAL